MTNITLAFDFELEEFAKVGVVSGLENTNIASARFSTNVLDF